MSILRWRLKQKLAEPSRYYGDGGTIHSNGILDVELYEGHVVAVWFRCQALPWREHEIDGRRADEMRAMYSGHTGSVVLTGVEVRDPGRASSA